MKKENQKTTKDIIDSLAKKGLIKNTKTSVREAHLDLSLVPEIIIDLLDRGEKSKAKYTLPNLDDAESSLLRNLCYLAIFYRGYKLSIDEAISEQEAEDFRNLLNDSIKPKNMVQIKKGKYEGMLALVDHEHQDGGKFALKNLMGNMIAGWFMPDFFEYCYKQNKN